MNKQDIDSMVSQIEKEDSLFAKKASLDSLLSPSRILGRKKQAEQLVRYLLGYKQGFVVPYISVYGRSGAGKSSVVRFVCNNMDLISHVFVNLRQAKTVFGAANLILAQLGIENLKSAQGINLAVDTIGKEIESVIEKTGKKLFVLVLDELDVIFYDKRGKPSDFIYKLIVMEEKLRQKEILLCIIGISDNVLSEYDLSSAEHGDARRAIDLLRVSAELASSKGEDLSQQHVEIASEELQKDRISQILSSASYHLKLVCGGLARITYLTEDVLHSTSVLYTQYTKILQKGTKPLSYRRISDLLTDLENTGLVVSQTSSKGRHGYGSQYKLVVSPEIVGRTVSEEWWNGIVKAKLEHVAAVAHKKTRLGQGSKHMSNLLRTMEVNNEMIWKRYVGLE